MSPTIAIAEPETQPLVTERFCSVADPFCDAPAGYGCYSGVYVSDAESGDPQAQHTCDRCGNDVCGPCSDERDLHDGAGKRRVCHNCQVEADGGEHVVMSKLHRIANEG